MDCWEFKQCGREPSGEKELELGICSATKEMRLDGVHGGKNAGRSCWVVAGTLCGGKAQGIFASKKQNCMACDFYRKVKKEVEDDKWCNFVDLLQKIS